MFDIVDEMRNEVINRSNYFEKLTRGTKDEYNLYYEHIQYVYNYVIMLSEDEDVDLEVLKLSALLHDISMTDINLDRDNHNEYSANIAMEYLKKYNYPQDKINMVYNCILNHSSKRKKYRVTKEEEILVNSDCISHVDSISNLQNLAHNVIGLSDEDSIKYVQDKLTRDFHELDDRVKLLIKDKYNRVMSGDIDIYKKSK